MAYTSGFTGDQTGMGEGLAFILPDSQAVKYGQQLAQTHSAQLQQMAMQKAQMAAKAQQQYIDDFKSEELPKAAAPFDTELNKRQNVWMADAAKQYSSTGKNPFNDPNFVARHNDEIVVPARQSLELWKNYTELRAKAEIDPLNRYSKESKQAVIDYQSQIEKDPMGSLNKPLPQLKETPATADDLVKTLKQSGDDSFNKAQVFSAVLGDPKWHDMLRSAGYNPDLPDFGIYTDPSHPNGKRVWYTNPTYTGHMADEILAKPDDPASKRVLDAVGIDPKNDKFAKEKLQHVIADQNDAMGKFVNNTSSRLTDPEKAQQLQDQRFDRNMKVKDYNLRVQEHGDLQDQRKWQREHQHGAVFTTNILYGDDAAREQSYTSLKKLYEGNPNYRKGLDIQDDGSTINITVPPRLKKNPNLAPGQKPSKYLPEYIETQPGYSLSLDKNDEESVNAGIFEVLKNVGAQNIKNVPQTKEAKPGAKPAEDKNKALQGWNQ